jgi:quercetin dioxygenase-like cupin family protein
VRNRRIANARLKRELDYTFRYPSYLEGEAAVDRELGSAAPAAAATPLAAPAGGAPAAATVAPAGGAVAPAASSAAASRLRVHRAATAPGGGAPLSSALGLSRVRCELLQVAPGGRVARPSAGEQLVYVLGGRADFNVDGVTERLAAGDALGLPDGRTWTAVNAGDAALSLLVVEG